jgi:hypothetical protein
MEGLYSYWNRRGTLSLVSGTHTFQELGQGNGTVGVVLVCTGHQVVPTLTVQDFTFVANVNGRVQQIRNTNSSSGHL